MRTVSCLVAAFVLGWAAKAEIERRPADAMPAAAGDFNAAGQVGRQPKPAPVPQPATVPGCSGGRCGLGQPIARW